DYLLCYHSFSEIDQLAFFWGTGKKKACPNSRDTPLANRLPACVGQPNGNLPCDLINRAVRIECLYPHPPHQRLDMPAADLAPWATSGRRNIRELAKANSRCSRWRRRMSANASDTGRGRYTLPRLMRRTSSCGAIGRSCAR